MENITKMHYHTKDQSHHLEIIWSFRTLLKVLLLLMMIITRIRADLMHSLIIYSVNLISLGIIKIRFQVFEKLKKKKLFSFLNKAAVNMEKLK
jgi:hypothetical protein